MSCYHPLTISNPSLVKSKVYSKSLIEVPCGHCVACKESKRMSWFVRLYYEWKYCKDNGGFALFETLTYNNEHLPHCLSDYDVMDRKLFPCFSKRDIQLYLKKIRKYFSTHYKGLDISGKIKYFCSMEYGGKTHRPHYHIVFFVSTPIIERFDFKYVVESLWHDNGFTKQGKMNYGFVCNAGGLSYCAKYVCKDIYEDEYFRKLDYRLKKCGFEPEQYKDCFPRNMQSTNLGIYALEFDKNNDLDNFLNGIIVLPDKDKIKKEYKLPLYYERKIFYDVRYRFFDHYTSDYILVPDLSSIPLGVDYSPVYILNDLGLEMKNRRLDKSIDAVSNVYRVVSVLPEYLKYVTKLNSKFKTNYDSIKAFQEDIKNRLPEEIFVQYSIVYRGTRPTLSRSSSPCGSSPYYDYMLINNMSRGCRPLSVDFDNLCYNIDKIHSLPFIEDLYCMIRYLYFLFNLDKERFFNDKDIAYVDQKSAYLSQTE